MDGARLHVSWAGDSEAVLFRKTGEHVVCTTPTHKPASASEQKRIEDLGGFVQEVNGVMRLNGILAVTRSFGDARCVAPGAQPRRLTRPA